MSAAGEADAVDTGGTAGAGDQPETDAARSVPAAKTVARREARTLRRALVGRRDLEADALRLATHVLDLVASRAAAGVTGRRVAAYTAYGTEPPTHRLVAALAADGWDVVVPVLLEDRSLDWTDLAGRPLGADAVSTANLVVTPGLAVDLSGTRLGQGGGSYDRALTRRRPDALVVTLLHDGELRPPDVPLPAQPHDVRVDAVVSADGGFVDLR